jgi:hypothetical protein
VSPGGVSTAFSAAVSELKPRAGAFFLPNYHVILRPGEFGLRAATRQSSAGSRALADNVAGVNKNHSVHRPNAGAGN